MAYSRPMTIGAMRRVAAILSLAALALSPISPAGSACLAACGRTPARAAHTCCRPRAASAPLTVRAPGCCRPGSERVPSVVAKAVELTPKTGTALAASTSAIEPAASLSAAAVLSLVRGESPPAPSDFRAVLRI